MLCIKTCTFFGFYFTLTFVQQQGDCETIVTNNHVCADDYQSLKGDGVWELSNIQVSKQ